jgi:DNA-binding Lrp family transcriptional regulator
MEKYSKMLSKKDMKILDVVRANCKLSTREISEKTGIPITTIHNRIKKMESDGTIKYYKAVIDNKKIGRGIQAYVSITCNYKYQNQILKQLTVMPIVEECYILTGTNDILIKVAVTDVEQLNNFVSNQIQNMKGIDKTVTSIVLMEVPVRTII